MPCPAWLQQTLLALSMKQLGIEKDEKGVILVKIEPDSPAEEAGLKKGDIVQELDRQKIANLNEFNKAAARINPAILYCCLSIAAVKSFSSHYRRNKDRLRLRVNVKVTVTNKRLFLILTSTA